MAEILSQIIYDNTLDGVYTHGINRFPRIVGNIDSGILDVNAEMEKVSSCGVVEAYDGHFGIGPVNAYRAVQRAVEIAHDKGTGLLRSLMTKVPALSPLHTTTTGCAAARTGFMRRKMAALQSHGQTPSPT